MTQSQKTSRVELFLENMENDIRPGTRGAPLRREKFHRVRAAHHAHTSHLTLNRHLRVERQGYYGHGAEDVTPIGIRRHGPGDPRREKLSRLHKMHRRLMGIIAEAPADDLIRWTRVLRIDIPRALHAKAHQYLNLYPAAKKQDRIGPDGTIYMYDHDTEWERYTRSKSYPRTVDRRIDAYTRTGCKTVRMLESGERAESALDACIPGRKQRRLEAKKIENAAKTAPIIAYKMVARTDDVQLVSIFDGATEYTIGQTTTDKLKKMDAYDPDPICAAGGIFVHDDADKARGQKYPEYSKALDLPRVLLKGEAYGPRREDGKIATTHFKPVEIVES